MGDRLTVDTVYGRMVINPHDTIRGRSLIETGQANDHPEIAMLVERLQQRGPEAVAIDVGANFGCFALAFIPHCAVVLAFEPQQDVFNMLAASLGLRERSEAPERKTIVFHRKAVGAHPGVGWMPRPDPSVPQDFGSIRLGGGPQQVDITTIDIAVREHGAPELSEYRAQRDPLTRVDLIKIDVEGMEMEVLEGARATIERFHPILYVEHLHGDKVALVAHIKSLGYRHVRSVGINLLADPSAAGLATAPIVAWPTWAAILAGNPSWSAAERAEWNRLADLVDRLTVLDELQGAELRAVERVQTRIGRDLAERCDHGILLWLECGHCNTHVAGDLPTLLSPAALATLERLAASAPSGDFVEVGVFRGGSAQRLYRIAEAQGRALWCFDTFTGLVDRSPLDAIPLGHFDAGGVAAAEHLQAVLPHARIIMGTFPDVLAVRPEIFVELLHGGIAFAHVDCDQYWSVKGTIAALWPRMVAGGLILCDDYDALHGARAAVDESAWSLAGLRRDQIERTPEGKAVLRKPR